MTNNKQPKFSQRIFAFFFVMQGLLIGVRGNLDVLSGKPIFDVLQNMITQGIELIIKAQSTQKSLKKRDEPEAPLRDWAKPSTKGDR